LLTQVIRLPSISFVIPAHNEELTLRACLESVRNAASQLECDFEMIVVDDDSNDRTAEIAEEFADRRVAVALRNIGAVRNAGAKFATKSLLIFIDADTRLPLKALRAILSTMRRGTVGGGALVRFDQRLDPVRHLLAYTFVIIWQDIFRYAAGCLVFVRRDLFEQVGGFDEEYFAAEEMYLSRKIKRRGKFRIVRSPVITSGRKMRTYGFWKLIRLAFGPLLRGPRAWRNRDRLGLLYEARRESSTEKSAIRKS
jgi:glycosyltransferase involved in cell wall biosynthesis